MIPNSKLIPGTTGQSMFTGIIVDANPNTFTLSISTMDYGLINDVPISNVVGATHNRDVAWLSSMRGCMAICIKTSGKYFCLGTFNYAVDSENIGTQAPIDSDTSTKSYSDRPGVNLSAGRERSFTQGDKVLRAGDGEAELGIFQAGLARIKAAPLCQIVLAKLKDLVRIVSRRMVIYSDFGSVEMFNKDGKVGLSIQGGANLTTESNPADPQYTVMVNLGTTTNGGDERLEVSLATVVPGADVASAGATLLMGKDGAVTLKTLGGTYKEDIAGDKYTNCGGAMDVVVSQGRSSVIGGSDSTTVSMGDISLIAAMGKIQLVCNDSLTITTNASLNIHSTSEVVVSSFGGLKLDGLGLGGAGATIGVPYAITTGPQALIPSTTVKVSP